MAIDYKKRWETLNKEHKKLKSDFDKLVWRNHDLLEQMTRITSDERQQMKQAILDLLGDRQWT